MTDAGGGGAGASASGRADGPLHLRFDPRTHPDAQQRIAAWRDAFSLSVDVRVGAEEIEGFAATITFSTFGSLLIADARYTDHLVVRDRATIARTGSEQVFIDVFPEGGAIGTVGGRPCRIEPGDCFVMDMRGTLRLRLLKGRFIGLIVPRRLFEAAAGGPVALHGLVLPAGTAPAKLIGDLLASLAAQVRKLPPEAADRIAAATLALIAACTGRRGRAPGHVPASDAATADKPQATLARLRRHIERHAADASYDPDVLARAYGLSRSTLYRLFSPHGGVASAIRRRRAALAEVAKASGFVDARALRRALRAVYDATPGQLRDHPPSLALVPGEASVNIGALLDELPS